MYMIGVVKNVVGTIFPAHQRKMNARLAQMNSAQSFSRINAAHESHFSAFESGMVFLALAHDEFIFIHVNVTHGVNKLKCFF